METYRNLDLQFIDGEWRKGKGSKQVESINPYTQETYATFQAASLDDIDEAYQSAKKHQLTWSDMNPFERNGIMRKAAEIMEQRKDELIDILVKDSGSTIIKATQEVELSISIIRLATNFPFAMETTVNQSMIPGKTNYLIRKPLGVVGVIGPFNYPMYLAMRSVAPALATGNAVVLKPSSSTPVSGGTLLGKIFEEAGIPKGVMHVLTPKTSEIGDAFYEHPIPKMISFTGSTEVGVRIGEIAGKNVKDTILELGGNNAFVVLDDADIDKAVRGAVFGRFLHSGQICMSVNRIIVEESVVDEFCEKFVELAKTIKVGDPEKKDTLVGPLISHSAIERLQKEIKKAKEEGAEMLLEGKIDGNIMGPTILKGTNDMTTAKNEMFGPVVTVIPVKDDEEALKVANDTEAGLSGALHTTDKERAFNFARKWETGMVHINDQSVNDEPYIAFGGEKMSGLGRFGREHSLDEFTTYQWISDQVQPRDYPF